MVISVYIIYLYLKPRNHELEENGIHFSGIYLFNMILYSCVHSHANDINSFFCLAVKHSVLYICHIFFIHTFS